MKFYECSSAPRIKNRQQQPPVVVSWLVSSDNTLSQESYDVRRHVHTCTVGGSRVEGRACCQTGSVHMSSWTLVPGKRAGRQTRGAVPGRSLEVHDWQTRAGEGNTALTLKITGEVLKDRRHADRQKRTLEIMRQLSELFWLQLTLKLFFSCFVMQEKHLRNVAVVCQVKFSGTKKSSFVFALMVVHFWGNPTRFLKGFYEIKRSEKFLNP